MDVMIGILILISGCGIGLLIGLFVGEGADAYFKYKTRIAELKAKEEERMEEYVKKRRGGRNE